MSFLAPLYLLAALTIGLPILFHLIQRKPRGEKIFSSLMFLSPSPPRLAKRSRLDQWFLLLMRALALMAIAFAFMRPFVRSSSLTDLGTVGKQRMILVDTSASMRREGVWPAAQKMIDQAIREAEPQDLVAVYQYDSSIRPVLSFEAIKDLPATDRTASLVNAVGKLSPTWESTDIGQALTVAAETLKGVVNEQNPTDTIGGEIVLITDLSNGSSLNRLEEYQWPKQVRVIPQVVKGATENNATMTRLGGENAEQESDLSLRVILRNSAESSTTQFQLCYKDSKEQIIKTLEAPYQVNPGESRVIELKEIPPETMMVELLGDQEACDNRVYFAVPNKRLTNVMILQNGKRKPEEQLGYFLQRIPLGSTSLEVMFKEIPTDQTELQLSPNDISLVVADHSLQASVAKELRKYISEGGHAVVALDEPLSADKPQTTESLVLALGELIGTTGIEVGEAVVKDYSMWGKIDFQHPLFLPLADPRFNDFTKVKFWKHRKLKIGDGAEYQELVVYDDGTPGFLELHIGQGKCWLLTAGWQPMESQLALSTKFVPLMVGMFRSSTPEVSAPKDLLVGQSLDEIAMRDRKLVDPVGQPVSVETSGASARLTQPGVYQLQFGEEKSGLAVNVPAKEFELGKMNTDRLEQLGLTLGPLPTGAKVLEDRRQMRNAELEKQQQVWRWCIIAAVLFIAAETLWSSFVSRNAPTILKQGAA
ncbi:MAG: hypothetical protein RLY14_3191 [Planctomycetota bacterium]|jgi:hypothetical protein